MSLSAALSLRIFVFFSPVPRIFVLSCRAFFLLRSPDALATLNAILRNASSEGTRIPMVSPDPLFPFWPLLWSTRARGRVIFVSDNVSDSLSDDIEKYLLPRYLDARDRAQYACSRSGASRIFHRFLCP